MGIEVSSQLQLPVASSEPELSRRSASAETDQSGFETSPSVPCFGQLAGAADGRKVRNGSKVSNRSQRARVRAARKAISNQ